MKGASEDELIAHARGGRARNSAGRLLSAARGRRHRAAGLVLAALRRDRERRRHQDRAVQPLSHARRDPRRRRGGRRGPHHALHRQRRPHRARSGDAVHVSRAAASRSTVRIKGGLLGHWSVWVQERRRAARRASMRSRRPARSRPTCSRSTRAVTDCNAAIFDVANDFHGVHLRLPRNPAPAGPARGHLVPRSERDARARARRRRSTASAPPIRISTTTPSCAQTSRAGSREAAPDCAIVR